MTAAVHVLLVSAQAAPNLLPALDPALKPAEAILLVSQAMRPRAEALQRVLLEAGVRVSRVDLPNEHDYPALEAALLELAAERAGQAIALNVTGGTKLMALAAQSIAQTAGWSVFYVDADTDEVIWLGKRAGQRLTEHLRLRHYLMGYGFTLAEREDHRLDADRSPLIATLLTQIASLEPPLGQLNWLAQQAEDRDRLTAPLDERQRDNPRLGALLRHFAELGLRDKAANLEVTDAGGVKNELDVVFLARNRLFIIECKTARMDRPQAPKANDALFKLAEIARRVGGLGARGLLVSYRPVRDAEKKLAEALGIELVCHAGLNRLEEALRRWVRP